MEMAKYIHSRKASKLNAQSLEQIPKIFVTRLVRIEMLIECDIVLYIKSSICHLCKHDVTRRLSKRNKK